MSLLFHLLKLLSINCFVGASGSARFLSESGVLLVLPHAVLADLSPVGAGLLEALQQRRQTLVIMCGWLSRG